MFGFVLLVFRVLTFELAILKINGAELLEIQDDGGFIRYVK